MIKLVVLIQLLIFMNQHETYGMNEGFGGTPCFPGDYPINVSMSKNVDQKLWTTISTLERQDIAVSRRYINLLVYKNRPIP